MEYVNSYYKPLLELMLDPAQVSEKYHAKAIEVIDKASGKAKNIIPEPLVKFIPEENMKKIEEKIAVLTEKAREATNKAKLSSDKMLKIFEVKKSLYLIESGLAGSGLLALVASSVFAIFSKDEESDDEHAKKASAKMMKLLFGGGLTTFGVLALTTATVISEMEKRKRREEKKKLTTEEEKNADHRHYSQ